ncbi:MAG: hypothetical protein WD960_00335 [Gemmatimonadota bacterium]
MKIRSRILAPSIVALLTIFTGACAAGGGASVETSSLAPLTVEEIQDVSANNLYEVVASLRPQWLRSRGSLSISNPSAGEPVVYVNQMRMGSIEVLRELQPLSIVGIQWITASDATTRFGLGHAGGVIQVLTRRSPD